MAQNNLSYIVSSPQYTGIIAYGLFQLGEPLWVDLVSLEFLKHRLGQYRQLIAETASGYADMFTSVKEVETQLGEGGIVNIFRDGIREQLAEELGEGSVSWRSV